MSISTLTTRSNKGLFTILSYHPAFASVNGKHLAWLILATWFCISCALASMPAYVPDEAWFLVEAVDSGQRVLINGDWLGQLVFHRNAFGYGGLWWSTYTAITLILHGLLDFLRSPEALAMVAGDPYHVKVSFWEYAPPSLAAPMFMMRFLALLSLAAFGALFVRHARSATAALLSIMLLITLPIAWWSGKVASPELLCSALYASAVFYWFVLHKEIPALLLSSLSVAMKLSVAPLYLVLLAFIFWDMFKSPDRSTFRFVMYGVLCATIFLLGNLWLLYMPQEGIEQLISLSQKFKPNPDWHIQANLLLFLSPSTWDGTNYGSLSYWSGSLVLLVVSLLVTGFVNRSLGLFLLIGGFAEFLFMMTQPPHAWYWFPFIFAAIVPFSLLRPVATSALAVVLVTSLWPFKFTQEELNYKRTHLMELQEVSRQRTCITQKLYEYKPDVVFDMASIGTFSSETQNSKWQALDFKASYLSLSGISNALPNINRVLIIGEKDRTLHNFLITISNKRDSLLGTCGKIQFIKV